MQLFMTSVSSGVETIGYLKNIINSETKLVILPFAHHFDYISCKEDIYNHYDRDPLNKDSIFWKTSRPFIDIGINPDRISVINRFDDPIGLIKHKLLSDNTIVYLPGGFPENIVKILKELGISETIKNCKIVVGESAGSMFWNRTFFVYPDQDYRKYQCYRGIGLTKKIVILPHYNNENKKTVLGAVKRFKKFHKQSVFLIKDGGWVWYDSNSKKVISYKDTYIIE